MRRIPKEPIGFRLCHELEGLLGGVQADGQITSEEVQRVIRWREAATAYADIRPFSEIVQQLDRALADRMLTDDECEDLRFLTQKYTTVNPHFSALRSGVQQLQGLVAGLSSDRQVSAAEVKMLEQWIEEWNHLRGIWPYDECEALVVGSITNSLDRSVSDYLAALSSQFPIGGHLDLSTGEIPPPVVTGICVVNPEIQFTGRQFVLTGESQKAGRAAIEAKILAREGIPQPRLTQKTDYLIVCDGGNPLWAFGCYGRKVEAAYNLRREGHHVQLILERDLWDALVD